MVSERRNELIAELFHRVHFIEKWGRGIRLIISKEPTAEFKEVGTHFIVVFYREIGWCQDAGNHPFRIGSGIGAAEGFYFGFLFVEWFKKRQAHEVVPMGMGEEKIKRVARLVHQFVAQPSESGSCVNNDNVIALGPNLEAGGITAVFVVLLA